MARVDPRKAFAPSASRRVTLPSGLCPQRWFTLAPRILVAEDSETFRRPLQRTLETAGYEVTAVATAEEALAMLRRRDTDLVLTDIRLPGMDGLTLVRRIRTEYPPLPVIVMTAHGGRDLAADAAALGAADCLVKPFEPGALLEAIRRAIARSERPAGVIQRRPA